MTSTRLRTTKRAGAVALALAAGSAGIVTTAGAASATNWDAVAQCESGGAWNTSTGNGFSGGLQFTPSTWAANGGTGDPSTASRAEQIQVAESVKSSQGMGAWPVCGAQGGSGASTYSSNSTESAVPRATRSTHRNAVPQQSTTHKSTHVTTSAKSYKPATEVLLSRKLQRQTRDDVRAWQTKLASVSHLDIAIDGKFGPDTEAATKKVQARNHRAVDGVVGPQTRSIYKK